MTASALVLPSLIPPRQTAVPTSSSHISSNCCGSQLAQCERSNRNSDSNTQVPHAVRGRRGLEEARLLPTAVFDKIGVYRLTSIVSSQCVGGIEDAEALRLAAGPEQDAEHPVATAIITNAAERRLTAPRVRRSSPALTEYKRSRWTTSYFPAQNWQSFGFAENLLAGGKLQGRTETSLTLAAALDSFL